MEKTFKPLMAKVKEEEYIDILMRGNGIRKDCGGHDYYDIIPRERITTSTGTVGCGDNERTSAADEVLKDVLRNMKKNGYIVLSKPSSDIYKGRFKATTYYLAGE